MDIRKGIYSIEIIDNDKEIKEFWRLLDEYMIRDILPYASLGRSLTEEDKKWFFSDDYRNALLSVTKRSIDQFHLAFLKEEDIVVGFVDYGTYFSEDGKCLIAEYCILPEYRNRGLGHYFFQMIKDSELKKGAKYFVLNVSNERNKHFWEEQGFVENGYDEYGSMLMKLGIEDKREDV
jgi:ribosomal protein S18 acetylase RimI-like enzyme